MAHPDLTHISPYTGLYIAGAYAIYKSDGCASRAQHSARSLFSQPFYRPLAPSTSAVVDESSSSPQVALLLVPPPTRRRAAKLIPACPTHIPRRTPFGASRRLQTRAAPTLQSSPSAPSAPTAPSTAAPSQLLRTLSAQHT
eukprot:4947812-Pyramimonas_sp.AAC.2